MPQQQRQARPVRLSEPGRIPDDPPSVTLEHPAPPPVAVPPPQPGPPPDSRSPYEVVHDEGYLLRCLKRHYGWASESETVLVKARLL